MEDYSTAGIKNKYRGMIFILDGLSGGGKTTLARMITQTEKHIEVSVSATTRDIRPGETNGIDYHFITKEEFLQKNKEGFFLETTDRFGNLYGTPKQQVADIVASGNDIIFDIDYVGTRALTKNFPEDVVRIFLMPPSFQDLKERLDNRESEDRDLFAKRKKENAEYLENWEEYDYIFINDTIQSTLRRLQQILRAERLKRNRQPFLEPFVEDFKKCFK
ncbi:MAG: guanylate kinase [Proteobacteria bacterium]|nr:guanylate kinase [Pseudomonadota bacterium]